MLFFWSGVTISIHAPLRGRRLFKIHFLNCTLFQSTPPCGGDLRWKKQKLSSKNFNPRPLAGATVKIYARDWSRRFQSTPPCGGDRNPPDNPHRQPDFNPRPLAGATCHKYQHDNYTIISIHAPLRGRPTAVSSRGLSWSFQSTPPCGGDLSWLM